jgi:hypothetical protein
MKQVAKEALPGLDVPPKFVSRTCTLNYQRDIHSLKMGKSVLLQPLSDQGELHRLFQASRMIHSGVAHIGAGRFVSLPSQLNLLPL